MLDAAPATPLTASPPFPVARSSLLVSVARPHPRLAGRPCRLDAAPLPWVVFHPSPRRRRPTRATSSASCSPPRRRLVVAPQLWPSPSTPMHLYRAGEDLPVRPHLPPLLSPRSRSCAASSTPTAPDARTPRSPAPVAHSLHRCARRHAAPMAAPAATHRVPSSRPTPRLRPPCCMSVAAALPMLRPVAAAGAQRRRAGARARQPPLVAQSGAPPRASARTGCAR